MEIIIVRPGRCNTCKHHIMGDCDLQQDYQEHWCKLEENEWPGWFPGMHMDHCVFPASCADEVCSTYEMVELQPDS